MICIYTEFRRSNNNHTQVICVYCDKLLVDLKEHWSFGLDQHPIIKDMIEKDLLICDCDYAKKNLSLRKKIKEYKNKIKISENKLSELLYLVNPYPF